MQRAIRLHVEIAQSNGLESVHRERHKEIGELPRQVALLGVHQGLGGAVVCGQQPADVVVNHVEALVKPRIIYVGNTSRIPGKLQGKGDDPAGVGIGGQGRQQIASAKRIDHGVGQIAGAQSGQERRGPRQIATPVALHSRFELLAMPVNNLCVDIGGQCGVAAASHHAIEKFGFRAKIRGGPAIGFRRSLARGKKDHPEDCKVKGWPRP